MRDHLHVSLRQLHIGAIGSFEPTVHPSTYSYRISCLSNWVVVWASFPRQRAAQTTGCCRHSAFCLITRTTDSRRHAVPLRVQWLLSSTKESDADSRSALAHRSCRSPLHSSSREVQKVSTLTRQLAEPGVVARHLAQLEHG